jgi:hypothetical protein
MNCSIVNDTTLGTLTGDALAALYCACATTTNDNVTSTCYSICPNPDLAGVGVRAAFYAGSMTNGEYRR